LLNIKKSLLDPDESLLDPDESLLDPDKSLLDPDESLLDPDESLLDPDKLLLDLDKFGLGKLVFEFKEIVDFLSVWMYYVGTMQCVYRAGFFLVVLLAGGYAGFSQDVDSLTIPDAVRRPSRTETPRYPSDSVIGDLGQGELSLDDFNFASNVLRALMQGREQSPLLAALNEGAGEEFIEKIQGIRAFKFRVGGGKEIVDGAGSFLFRFIGRDGHLGGAIYFVRGEDGYVLDDIILDKIPQNLLDENKDRTSNKFPYERFY
jgi:hypothetical protein